MTEPTAERQNPAEITPSEKQAFQKLVTESIRTPVELGKHIGHGDTVEHKWANFFADMDGRAVLLVVPEPGYEGTSEQPASQEVRVRVGEPLEERDHASSRLWKDYTLSLLDMKLTYSESVQHTDREGFVVLPPAPAEPVPDTIDLAAYEKLKSQGFGHGNMLRTRYEEVMRIIAGLNDDDEMWGE